MIVKLTFRERFRVRDSTPGSAQWYCSGCEGRPSFVKPGRREPGLRFIFSICLGLFGVAPPPTWEVSVGRLSGCGSCSWGDFSAAPQRAFLCELIDRLW